MSEFLFLYGTLLPELTPATLRSWVAQLRRVGPATLAGRLHDLGPYPGVVLDREEGTQVVGQVFRLPSDPAVLAVLDAYEGFDPADLAGSVFVRVLRPVTLADGPPLSCWVYAYNLDPGAAPLVPGGDYLAWRCRS